MPFRCHANRLRAVARWRCNVRRPWAKASRASGTANLPGISEASTLAGAINDNNAMAAHARREGRHSSRQAADALDERCEIGICGLHVAHEPVPELIVLAFQQA